jgi:polar amino acid transport system substrate-binding protein
MSSPHRIIVLLIALALIATALPVLADSSWTKVKDRDEVVVGLCAQYPPFESKNEKTGQLEGFDIDIGKALSQKLGVKAKFIWHRIGPCSDSNLKSW